MKLFAFITAFYIFFPSISNAYSPTGNVGGAKVNKGDLYLEYRSGYSRDDETISNDKRFQMRQHIDYGFNDWYALRIITSQDKRDDKNLEHNAIALENRFQIIEKNEYGWDGGLRIAYSHKDGDKTPHEIDLNFIAQIPLGSNYEWDLRHNIIIEHDIGENSKHGLSFELRNQLTKSVTPPDYLKSLRIGVGIFNDFGKIRDMEGFDSQDHQIGPVIKGSLDNGLYFQTGYRAGISENGAEHLMKLFIGKKF